MKVYVLQHVHSVQDGKEDVKLIGVYSSRENAQAAIARSSQAPGFSNALAGFQLANQGGQLRADRTSCTGDGRRWTHSTSPRLDMPRTRAIRPVRANSTMP